MLVPSQGRKSSSQGGGMVGGGVVSSVGTPQESASTVINNINNVTNVVAGDYSKITRITITDLLALDPSEVGENDLYIVYAGGSDTDGWSGDDFTYDGNTYPAESFFQLINGEWTPITDEIDLTKTLKFDDLPDTVYMIESLFPQTSYPNIYGRDKAGMRLARIGKYQVDEKGNYKPVFETTGTPGGGASSNWLWTISVPYARSYMQGGGMVYEGGVLSSADYQQLKELAISGGANIFFATYNNTTHAEIKGAINAGKAVILKKGTEMYLLTSAATSTDPAIKERYVFSKVRENQILLVTVNNENTWVSTITTLLEDNDIRTSEEGWGGFSDREVPSSKLVKETFDALSDVATSGDYDDLINKPTIPDVTDVVKYTAQSLTDAQKTQARQNIGAGTSSFSGSYNDLTNKPTIPDVTGLVTLDTDQRITGNKTFKTSLWGQLSLWADGSYKEHPCLNFYSVQGQSVEGVGSIGVERTGYLSGYPAYWQSQQGLPQRLVREDERGSSVNPIYIDNYGKTKQCNISFPEYSYKVFSYQLDISQGVSDEFTLGTLITLSGGSLPSGVTLSMGRKSSSRLSMRINSSLIGENSKVQLESVMITAGSFKTGYEVAIVNEDQQGVSSGTLNFEFILRHKTTGAQVSASDLATSTTYDLYFHVGMMCKN